MPSNDEHPALTTVQDMFKKIIDVPYCTGTFPLDAPQSLLFYRSNDEPRCIDFANPGEAQLKALAEACAPASFGRNQEDILDENYRKAGKMDSADFATQFSPWDSSVLKSIVESLFKADKSIADVTTELYKLNVYGPGSFFKAHVDTPRSDTMFGSLVVVLPTPHTGGSLLFRHHSTEYTFDSAEAVSGSSPDAPHAAFAAFFSDVEHEVAEVTSGYRVTLTYNLYHAAPSPSDSPSGIMVQNDAQTVLALRTAIASLLTAPNFLPDGGLLAFGLSYEYPFNQQATKDQPRTRLSKLMGRLKGVDALLKRVCDELELKASLKTLYLHPRSAGEYCLLDGFIQIGYLMDQSLFSSLCRDYDNTILAYDALSGQSPPTWNRRNEVLGVVWAKPLDNQNSFKQQYIAHGNEASLCCAYGKVCLVVRIKPTSERGSSGSAGA